MCLLSSPAVVDQLLGPHRTAAGMLFGSLAALDQLLVFQRPAPAML
jgi:hypothetical protein